MIKLLSSILILLLTAAAAGAATSTAYDPVRLIYAGRTMGMGGAHVALSDDGEGLFTNPSGLARLEFPQLVGMTKRMITDSTSYTLWGWALPTDWGTIGFGYAGSLVGDSYPTIRDTATGRIVLDPSNEAMAYDSSVTMFSYARALPWYKLSVGANLKFFSQTIRTSIPLSLGNGTNLDISASAVPFPFTRLGVNYQNVLNNRISWKNSSERIARQIKAGAALNLIGATGEAIFPGTQSLVTCVDFDMPYSLYHFGLEWNPDPRVFIRTGINQRQDGVSPSFGIGFKHSAFRFDYAYMAVPGIGNESPHYFSLAYVGERVFSTGRHFVRLDPDFKFSSPADRSIQSSGLVKIAVTPGARRIFEQRSLWTIPLIETTSEAREVVIPGPLTSLSINGYPVSGEGTVETYALLDFGRNVIRAAGLSRPDRAMVTSEVHVLRVAPYSDVPPDHWAFEPIMLSSIIGLFNGYPSHSFDPERGITRAEMAVILVRASNIGTESLEAAADDRKFSDTAGKWFEPYINTVTELNLITSFPDKTFKPKELLSRAEAVAILSRFANLTGRDGIPFPDLRTGFWANRSIQGAKEAGLLRYLGGKNFEPEKYFSRAEAAEILYRTAAIQRKTNDFWEYGTISRF